MTLGKMILFAKKGDRYSVAISDIQDLRLLGSSRIYLGVCFITKRVVLIANKCALNISTRICKQKFIFSNYDGLKNIFIFAPAHWVRTV